MEPIRATRIHRFAFGFSNGGIRVGGSVRPEFRRLTVCGVAFLNVPIPRSFRNAIRGLIRSLKLPLIRPSFGNMVGWGAHNKNHT